MEIDSIKLKREIDYFYSNSEESFEFSRFKTGSVITFPLAGSHIIRIESDVNFSFQFDTFNTKTFRLSKADFEYYGFSNHLLDQIAEKFSLIKKTGLNKNYYSLYFQVFPDFETCVLAFQKKSDQIFMIILASKRQQEARSAAEDFYGDNVFYINDIWEVDLSKEFEKKIFG